MYLWAQAQDMPTTYGLDWVKNGEFFKKSILTSQTSFSATQWLYWLQEQPICFNIGEKLQLQHAYFRGEYDYNGYKPDGYLCKNGEHHFFEFLGCYHHPG